MSNLSAVIRLRPTRIALLTRPNDIASIRRFMRICACLWGGSYNPIIPVFRTPPKEWRPKHPERVNGYAIARGYVEFFEPDAYIEAEEGLLEEAGLGALRAKRGTHDRVIALSTLLRQLDHRDWSAPALGLCVTEVLGHIYETEQRFQLRDKRPAILVTPQRGSALVEAMFGAYPAEKPARYIGKGFEDVYRPEKMPLGQNAWLKIFKTGAETPLRVTRFGLEAKRSWMHDLVVFVFDPDKATDLIDLWNLRLEPNPVLPVPMPWFADLADEIRKALIAAHRPLQGNPNGVMRNATVEFARSIAEERARPLVDQLKQDIPDGALCVKFWRTPIWVRHTNDFVHRDGRLEVTAAEKRLSLAIEEGETPTARFEALAPDFAAQYGGHDLRWVNAVQLSVYGAAGVASVVPFNTFDWNWPRLDYMGETVAVGSEGWVFGQRYKEATKSIQLHRPEEIIIGALRRAGIEAKLSEPGHIAKQVLEHLGGMWGVHLLADRPTLVMMNEMAGGLRRRARDGVETEEVFDRRSKPLKDWKDLLARRNQPGRRPKALLEAFTNRNIIRVGVETVCPHCQAANWHSLTAADYVLGCERCLKKYPFPQADIRSHSRNWVYRVVGPFSVPDFARGSYGALLALNVLVQFGASRDATTFSTALSMRFDGIDAEADFVALHARETMDRHQQPHLIIGEAKSFGEGDLIKATDLAKLRAIGTKLPGSVIVVSVMRDDFTPTEKTLLTRFVKWGRRPDAAGEPTNPVLLLTGVELFHEFSVGSTWKKKGGRHADFSEYNHTRNLSAFAESTQAIYLDLPPHYEERRKVWEKRRGRARATSSPSATRSPRKAD